MSYRFLKELIELAEEFERDSERENVNVAGFSRWLTDKHAEESAGEPQELPWEGKQQGRTADSVINTSLLRLYRYAKIYSKAAVVNSPFTTIDEVIFLLNLFHNGRMTKIQLIELNIHEKSTGIQIINRLLSSGFIQEEINSADKRSKVIAITEKGMNALHDNMQKVRMASAIVVGDLNPKEKLQLIRLLQKLEIFHKSRLDSGRVL